MDADDTLAEQVSPRFGTGKNTSGTRLERVYHELWFRTVNHENYPGAGVLAANFGNDSQTAERATLEGGADQGHIRPSLLHQPS